MAKSKLVVEGGSTYNIVAWHRAGHPAYDDMYNATMKVPGSLSVHQYDKWWERVCEEYTKVLWNKKHPKYAKYPPTGGPPNKVDAFMESLAEAINEPFGGGPDVLEHY